VPHPVKAKRQRLNPDHEQGRHAQAGDSIAQHGG